MAEIATASESSPARYRIGELAALAGTTSRTIRYYEELGLLGADSERPKGGHRLYSDADLARLQEVVRLRDLLGLSLEELVKLIETEQTRECLRARYRSAGDDVERERLLRESLPLVERQLELVRARRHSLEDFERELEDKRQLIERRLEELAG
jgi:DNA-binding transcriptional MerR regulator